VGATGTGDLRVCPEAAAGTVYGAELVTQYLLGQVDRLATGGGDEARLPSAENWRAA
jgi:hypothetical protein